MLKIIGIALIGILAISEIIIFILIKAKLLPGDIKTEVADIERKVIIWGKTIPGNSKKSKLQDMNIDYNETNPILAHIKFTSALVNKDYKDEEQIIDTFTYLYEIKAGYEKETYEDEPYIIPYLVQNSKIAVIVVPGGGYGFKSMDGDKNEGQKIAKSLNKNGINAFVLHYRSNPYEYPIPILDLQRVIRYLRYHSEEYNIDKDKISLMGFSAGGNMIATFINKLQGKDMFPSDYEKDDIDRIDDYVLSAGMIYPALSYRANVPMLFCSFKSKDVKNEHKRNMLLDKTDLYADFNSSDIKQFIVYGTKDAMVGMEETKKYIKIAQDNKTNVKCIEAKNQPHGMSQKYYMEEYIKWINDIMT